MAEVRLLAASELEPNSARRVDVEGHRLVVVRLSPAPSGDGEGDEWYVLDDRCSHAEASLSEGELWPEDREIECPRHGSSFELGTGKAVTLPATQPQGVYPVRLEGDDVIVELPS